MNYTWTHLETETTLDTTTEGLRASRSALGVDSDQLADLLTGYNCDSYADAAEELVEQSDGVPTEAIEYDPDTYDRCRAYHRILNLHLDDATCEEYWLIDFTATAS